MLVVRIFDKRLSVLFLLNCVAVTVISSLFLLWFIQSFLMTKPIHLMSPHKLYFWESVNIIYWFGSWIHTPLEEILDNKFSLSKCPHFMVKYFIYLFSTFFIYLSSFYVFLASWLQIGIKWINDWIFTSFLIIHFVIDHICNWRLLLPAIKLESLVV